VGRDATSNLLSSAPETGRSSFASRKLPDAIECSRPSAATCAYEQYAAATCADQPFLIVSASVRSLTEVLGREFDCWRRNASWTLRTDWVTVSVQILRVLHAQWGTSSPWMSWLQWRSFQCRLGPRDSATANAGHLINRGEDGSSSNTRPHAEAGSFAFQCTPFCALSLGGL